MKKSNVHYLTTTLAAASLLFSASSSALGIGEMKLQSALNQNLRAEIGLILSDGETANDFKVNLAPNAKFDEAGIPWTLFLSKIKFKIVPKNGKTVIELSSTEVLKEPFLDFLIEVKSAKGSLYREFTVLIDPPAAYQNANAPIPDVKATEPQRFIAPPANQSAHASNYGPTRDNETLWSIAAQFNKQNNVSVHRMVAAIFIANPDAFQTNESHALITGKILKIPSFMESPELFIAAAGQEISHAPVVAKKTAAVKEKSVQKVTSPAKAAPPAKAPVEKKLSDEGLQRLAELEKQLAAMQKAIADKDLEMAALKATGKPALVVAAPSPIVPAIAMPAPLAPPAVQTTQPVAVMPPPALPTSVAPPPVVPAIAPVVVAPVTPVITPPVVAENYFGIPADLYYYAAGGVGSLLLGALGLLRLREQRKAKENTPVITPIVLEKPDEKPAEIVADTIPPADDSTDTMFSDTFEMENSAFEEAAAGFADMVNNDSDNHNLDDILYKADVYCTYGNTEQAIKLLRDEFLKNPAAHDYALRLLKLYQAQENKPEFKEFVFELVKLGKKDLPDFWSKVSDIAAEFYPEALFFMPPPAIPDSNAISTNEMLTDVNLSMKFEDDLDFDSMSFDDADDKEITFGELTVEETLTSGTVNDIFAGSLDETALEFKLDNTTPMKKEESTVNFGGFTLGDSLESEPLEFEFSKPKETSLELDFDSFAVAELETETASFAVPTTTEPELELDFGSFTVTEETLKTETARFDVPKADQPALELDFGSFTVAETLETAAVSFDVPKTTESELELDFGSFAVAEETLKTETARFDVPKADQPALELDFGSFAVAETLETETARFSVPKADQSALELDFGSFTVAETLETAAVSFDVPKTAESELELDFGNFAVAEETLKTETARFDVPKADQPALELDFGSFAVAEETLKTETASFAVPTTAEPELELDFENFAVAETLDTDAASFDVPQVDAVALELDFSGLTVAESMEALAFDKLEIEEPTIDFDGFAVPETFEAVKIAELEIEEPAVDFDGFAVPESAITETEVEFDDLTQGLDFGSFVVLESLETATPTQTLSEKLEQTETALDLAIKNFTFDEPEEIVIVETPKTVEPERIPPVAKPEPIQVADKPFAEPEIRATKKPLDFDTVNELVEERINQTYLELAKVHAKEEVQIEYLDMSDSQFADSLASEVLKKCQIKEQLCRQKITQEVLSKLC